MPDDRFNEYCEALVAQYTRENTQTVTQRLESLCGILRQEGDVVQTMFGGSVKKGTYVTGVGPARRITQVQALLYQLGKTEVQGQGGWEEQAGIVHQAVIVEGDLDAVEVVAWSHLLGAPSLGSGCRYKTIISDSEEHLLAPLER